MDSRYESLELATLNEIISVLNEWIENNKNVLKDNDTLKNLIRGLIRVIFRDAANQVNLEAILSHENLTSFTWEKIPALTEIDLESTQDAMIMQSVLGLVEGIVYSLNGQSNINLLKSKLETILDEYDLRRANLRIIQNASLFKQQLPFNHKMFYVFRTKGDEDPAHYFNHLAPNSFLNKRESFAVIDGVQEYLKNKSGRYFVVEIEVPKNVTLVAAQGKDSEAMLACMTKIYLFDRDKGTQKTFQVNYDGGEFSCKPIPKPPRLS